MGQADLHVHSRHGDGMATIAEILEFVERKRPHLDVIAITEHDTMRASEEARTLAETRPYGFDVAAGIEVTTLDGHLLALFVDEPPASFRRIEETIAEIHRQGGLAIIPHPLSWLTRSISARVIERVVAIANDGVHFDGIEEHNQSPAGRIASARARRLNELHGLAAIGSSDAHFLESIGSAYTTFEGEGAAGLREAIESRTTRSGAGRAPSLRELGYLNVAHQSWRGMMATPRNAGWRRTLQSFIVSHRRPPAVPGQGHDR